MPEAFDAVIVGSGASGGWAAKCLTERGLNVALLEAGQDAQSAPPGDRDRQPVQSQCYAYTEETAHEFVNDVDNPYTYPPEKPFEWIRSRQVGGRLRLWGKMVLRLSDLELKAASRDGHGADWPLGYADLAPHYDRVERFLRVCGEAAGLSQVPDGTFLEPPPLSAGELRFRAAVESRWPGRRVLAARVAQAPPEAMLAAAHATGRLTLITGAVVSRVLMSADGSRARGAAYLPAGGGEEREVRGRSVVLCASAIESARILLNSADGNHPDGVGNSSGALGRFLMDHTYGIGIDGHAPYRGKRSQPRVSFGCFVPAFRNYTEDAPGFIRGYGVELQVTANPAGLRNRIRNRGRGPGSRFWMRAFGEVLARPENRVTIDPETRDAWGIPVARIECAYGENERAMAADQAEELRRMAEAAGFEPSSIDDRLAPPGLSIHEMGTARMGEDPDSSVLDPYCHSWDVPNLVVADASCFVSSGFQNPTLTMMALADRACERLAVNLGERFAPAAQERDRPS